MTRFSKGDKVTAVKDIGGILRDHVPKGTDGVVIDTALFGPARVRFTIDGWAGNRQVELTVDDDEIG